MFPGRPTIIRNEYERLPGTQRENSSGAPRLYLGPNHVLSMRILSGREVARRFYYADITALRCEPTWWGYLIDGAFVTAALLIWAAYLTSTRAEVGALIIAFVASIIAIVALFVNALRGPTCRTWLHTANHTERLRSLRRYNTARRALALIHERIAAVQGDLEQESDDVPLPPFAPYTPMSPPRDATTIHRHDRRPMAAFFYLSLAVAAQSVPGLVYESDLTSAIGLWTALALVLLGPVAIVRSYGTDCPPAARRMALYILGFATASVPVTIILVGLLGALGVNVTNIGNIPDMLPSGGPVFFLAVALEVCAILVLSICAWKGLAALRRGR